MTTGDIANVVKDEVMNNILYIIPYKGTQYRHLNQNGKWVNNSDVCCYSTDYGKIIQYASIKECLKKAGYNENEIELFNPFYMECGLIDENCSYTTFTETIYRRVRKEEKM